jgi:hypothetical protein
MGQLSPKLRSIADGGLSYWCQGCEDMHAIKIGRGEGPRWGFNGNVDRPTFTPSVLVRYSDPDGELPDEVCHTFVTDGQVQFLADCTHQLAGQTLPFPDLPTEYQDRP